MSQKLKTIFAGGGQFSERSTNGGQIPSGTSSGTILTLTPPAGQRVKLTHLSTQAGNNFFGIQILIGTKDIFNGFRSLNGGQPVALNLRQSVGNFQPYAAGDPPTGNARHFMGETNESITINANTNTTSIIYYAYAFGE